MCTTIVYADLLISLVKYLHLHFLRLLDQKLTMPVSAEEYLGHVTENAALKICFAGRVEETQQILTMKDDFRLRIPDLQIKVCLSVFNDSVKFSNACIYDVTAFINRNCDGDYLEHTLKVCA